MAELQTETLDQLPRATAVSRTALTLVQEPGGPMQGLAVAALLGKLIGTQEATATLAELQALLGYDANTVALVFADPLPANNGWYRKTGASGGGAWAQFEILSSGARDAAAASAALAGHYANDAADVAVPGGAAGARGARYWSGVAQAAMAAAEAARAIATQDAADAGAYRAGVLAAVGGLPAGAQLPLQAVSRAVLAAIGIASLSAGEQAYLSEAGRAGLFRWLTGDQSASVAADPYQALYVAPASDAMGASGVWQRVHDGTGWASWAGVVADGISDWHLQLNSMLQHPELFQVRLKPGSTCFSRPLLKKSYMVLEGRGCRLAALNYGGWLGTAGAGQRAISTDPAGTSGCADMGFFLDMGKTGTLDGNTPGTSDQQQRVHGISPFNCDDYRCSDVWVKDCTGYAFVAFGGWRARFRDTRSTNAQVHVELSNAVGAVSENHFAEDGDGDIGCEALFHMLNGSRACAFVNPRGASSVAKNGILILNDSPVGTDMTKNRVEGGSVVLTSIAPALNIQNVVAARNDCTVIGTELVTRGVGTQVSTLVSAASASVVRLSQIRMDAGTDAANAVGYKINGNSIVYIDEPDTTVGAGLPDGSAAILFSSDDATPRVHLSGGVFTGKANGENRVKPDYPIVTVSGRPDLSAMPTPLIEPIGVGHSVTRLLAADSTGGDHRVFGARLLEQSTYRVRFAGRLSSPDRGAAVALDTLDAANIGAVFGGSARLQTSASDLTAPVIATIRTVSDGFDDGGSGINAGNYVRVSDTSPHGAPHQFELEANVQTAGTGPGDTIEVYLRVAATTGYGDYNAGSVTVLAGAAMTLEQIG